MDSLFKISTINTHGLLVEGLEKDNSEYLIDGYVENSIRSYTYGQSTTINTLSAISADGVETFKQFSVVSHDNPIDSSTFTVEDDGLYKISHIILPNQDWISEVTIYPNDLAKYNNIYYYNTLQSKMYKYVSGASQEVTLSEILTSDYSDYVVGTPTSTIVRSDKNTFIMSHTDECFNNICKSLLSKLPKECNTSKLSDDIFKRDLLWMAINVMKYCLRLNMFYEAQRYLENIKGCGWCTNTNLNGSTCGCN